MASGGGGGSSGGLSTAPPPAWHDFLERMSHPSASEFVKSIKSFIVSFSNKAPDPEKDSAAVQEFLAQMEGAFRSHTLWAGSSEEELESAGEGLEKYVMTKLFNRAFASLPEDVQSDEELSEKMALLQQFIQPENLDIKPIFQNETSWLLAQKELQKINMYKAPRDKLVCILNCCKVINNLLLNVSMASDDNPPGADDFLPVLIYVVIKANPPRLHSNLLYIQRYRRQSRLVSETAYFFTNILSAESFIWNIDAESLSMDELEFQKKMESAKAHLLGLSTQSESQRNESNQELVDTVKETVRDRGKDMSTVGNQKPSEVHEGSKDLEQAQPVRNLPSISDLEEEGASKLLKDDQLSKYFQQYPYLYANAGDLTTDDVEGLLNSYKKLVLMYVSLSKAASSRSSFRTPSTLKEDSNTLKNSEDATEELVGNEKSKEVIKTNSRALDTSSSLADDAEGTVMPNDSVSRVSSVKVEDID
ncbi:vacuolar protein sorting-associated protein 9A-like [Iris pallida]|uniref:Vacuolar protein sorting-associated protein 9A-like n=1 Tax=Iris pallida TaxID=29817 RepID=A0AAX6I608_IRIPA|nr:vacuolar protein sorting-associated protein 9A-like [Iris pallida]